MEWRRLDCGYVMTDLEVKFMKNCVNIIQEEWTNTQIYFTTTNTLFLWSRLLYIVYISNKQKVNPSIA